MNHQSVDVRSVCMQAVQDHYPKFFQAGLYHTNHNLQLTYKQFHSGKVQYRSKGIFPSEALLFYCLCHHHDTEVVVESGRAEGYSTEIFIRSEFEVYSFDYGHHNCTRDEELIDIPSSRRINFYHMDACLPNALPKVVQSIHDNGRIPAVLLDGPKGNKALSLGRGLINQISFFAIHDCSPNQSIHDKVLGLGGWITTDEGWANNYGWMDTPAWKNTYSNRAEVAAEAFGLAIIPGKYWNPSHT
jgi:hypothetical protein